MQKTGSGQERIQKIIKQVDQSEIASIKSTVAGILDLIHDPDSNVNDFKELIEVDPVLASQVLKVANSVYFGSRGQISEINQAVIWIGLESLREIALSHQLSQIFTDDSEMYGYSRQRLWRHCLAVALLAKFIYRMEFGKRGEIAYAAGLLHDIGIILEDQFAHDDFIRVLVQGDETNKPFEDIEKEILNFDHGAIGKAIIQAWGLPGELAESIGYHHEPLNAPDEYRRLAMVLFIADYLVVRGGCSFNKSLNLDKALFDQCCQKLGIESFAIDSLMNHLNREMAKMADHGFVSNG